MHTFTKTLMIDIFNLAATLSNVVNLLGLDYQYRINTTYVYGLDLGPPCVGLVTRWDIMRKLTLPKVKF